MIGTTFEILGSLGMFLFGMKVMSEALQKLSGDKLRALMRTVTSTRGAAIFSGFVVTCLVQSSSASTVMMVSFVNAGLLTLREAIGMIMGANLGTTTTFWLVSFLGFQFNLSKIALPILGVALPLIFLRKSKVRDVGEFIMGFGILFIGLVFLKDSVPDIRDNPEALAFIQHYTGRGLFSILFFFAFGTLLTIMVQSSSVAGAITITMAYKGWIDYPTACAIILGENVGTTITANLAALAGNTSAKRAALGHFIINIVGVIWAIALFVPLTRIVDAAIPGDPLTPGNIPLHMAGFHTLFNVINIGLLVGFVPLLARTVERVIKERSGPRAEHMRYESGLIPRTGELNVAEAERDVRSMGALTRELVSGFVDLFEHPPADIQERVKALKIAEEKSDKLAVETTDYLLRCSAGRVSESTMNKLTALLRVVAEFEDICDCGYRLVMLAERKHRKGRELAPEVHEQVREFSEVVLRFMDFTHTFLSREIKASDMESAYQLENFVDRFRKNLRKESMRRMQQSGDAIKAEMLYIDVLNNMEAIGNHCLNALQALRHAN
jgi:phosphate:Na+ symporter